MSEKKLNNREMAPELIVSKWLNSKSDLSVQSLRGKVVAIHAFQMLCPGCILHGIPQAKKIFEMFNSEHVAVLGLHTVFEHHEGMQEKSLQAFLHEFRVKFPVGIDKPSQGSDIPQTMQLYSMRGTPTWVIIDRKGNLRLHVFGQVEDLILGAEITKLALEGQQSDIELIRRG